MKLFQPEVRLLKQKENGEVISYLVHIITFFNNTNIKGDGYSCLPKHPNEDGVYHIELKVMNNESINVPYLTPVVHTLDIPSAYLEGGNGKIKITINNGSTRNGETTVLTADADETIRPIEEINIA